MNTAKIFSEYFLAIETNETDVVINKPVNLDLLKYEITKKQI